MTDSVTVPVRPVFHAAPFFVTEQEEELAEDQTMVVLLAVVGFTRAVVLWPFAVMETVGVRTVTVAFTAGGGPYEPPVQERAYEVVGGDGGTEAGTFVPEIWLLVLKPFPVQAVAQSVPPGTDQERLTFCPCSTVPGETESEEVQVPGQTPVVQEPPFVGPFGWLTPVAQEGETVWPEMASVTVTVALFCPVVVYTFETLAVVPERPSVPVQE